MSYITSKFEEGEVHVKDNGVCGWLFESGEFRPLRDDAMQELLKTGLINDANVIMTHFAYDDYIKASVGEYKDSPKNQCFDAEFLFDLQVEFNV